MPRVQASVRPWLTTHQRWKFEIHQHHHAPTTTSHSLSNITSTQFTQKIHNLDARNNETRKNKLQRQCHRTRGNPERQGRTQGTLITRNACHFHCCIGCTQERTQKHDRGHTSAPTAARQQNANGHGQSRRAAGPMAYCFAPYHYRKANAAKKHAKQAGSLIRVFVCACRS